MEKFMTIIKAILFYLAIAVATALCSLSSCESPCKKYYHEDVLINYQVVYQNGVVDTLSTYYFLHLSSKGCAQSYCYTEACGVQTLELISTTEIKP